jgi:hypothetical protein
MFDTRTLKECVFWTVRCSSKTSSRFTEPYHPPSGSNSKPRNHQKTGHKLKWAELATFICWLPAMFNLQTLNMENIYRSESLGSPWTKWHYNPDLQWTQWDWGFQVQQNTSQIGLFLQKSDRNTISGMQPTIGYHCLLKERAKTAHWEY